MLSSKMGSKKLYVWSFFFADFVQSMWYDAVAYQEKGYSG